MGSTTETHNDSEAQNMKSQPQTITIAPKFKKNNMKRQQVIVLPKKKEIIVIPQSMLLTMATKNNTSKYFKEGIYNKPDSTYGSGSESEETNSIKSENPKSNIIKKPRLHNLSEKDKLIRRRLKNREAAQTARDKKRAKLEEMEGEVQRLKAHAKSLQVKNAQLINENLLLKSEADEFKLEDFGHLHDDENEVLIDDLYEMDLSLFQHEDNNVNEEMTTANDPFLSSANTIFANELINTFGDLFPELPNFNTLY